MNNVRTLSGKLLDLNACVIAIARSTEIGPGNATGALRNIDANAKPVVLFIRQEDEYDNVTLVCKDDTQDKAHKAILAWV